MKQKKIMAWAGVLLVAVFALAALFPVPPSAAAEGAVGEAATTTATAPGGRAGDGDEAATIGGAVTAFIREEAAGILSGATFLLTLILSLAFRKRIMPSLLDALGALIGKSREAVGAITEGHEAVGAELAAVLARTDEMLAEARTAAEAAERAAASLSDDAGARVELSRILSEQSDLLYELLMSANLPQYQKDRIGAAHAAATAAIRGESHD